jgi:hypothetical protein
MSSVSQSPNLSEDLKNALAMARRTLEYARIDGVEGEAIKQLEESVRRYESGDQPDDEAGTSYGACKSPCVAQYMDWQISASAAGVGR